MNTTYIDWGKIKHSMNQFMPVSAASTMSQFCDTEGPLAKQN